MFKVRFLVLSFLIVSTVFCGVTAYAEPVVSAQSAIVIETSGNRIIYQKNPHKKLPMASTTKIMTAICAIEAGNIDRTVTVDDSAIGVEGSSIYLAKGERLTIRELIYGLMLHSGNDAAVAIACAVSGSVEEFAKLMNFTAAKIGAVNTHFDNPNGLDSENHYTTAYDLAVITAYGLKNEEFREIVSSYTATIPNGDKTYPRKLKNHNRLLKSYDGCIGVKTGYTRRCGRCLVTAAERGNTRLVAVTLNDGNDWEDHAAMLDYGFDSTICRRVIKKGEYIQRITVNGSEEIWANAVAESDLYVTLPEGADGKTEVMAEIYSSLTAPVNYGTIVGEVTVTVDGIQSMPLNVVCDRSVPAKEKHIFLRNLTLLAGLTLQIY